MTQLVLFLLSPVTQMVLFIGTLVTMFMAPAAAQKGNFARARTLGMLCFMGSTLIIAQEVAVFVLMRNSMAVVMIALWSWIAWQRYRFLKSLPQKK